MSTKQCGQEGWSISGTGTGDREGWRGAAFSRVDSDNLPAASADQEDPVETLSKDFKELHVWERMVKETRSGDYNTTQY